MEGSGYGETLVLILDCLVVLGLSGLESFGVFVGMESRSGSMRLVSSCDLEGIDFTFDGS